MAQIKVHLCSDERVVDRSEPGVRMENVGKISEKMHPPRRPMV